MWLKTIKGRLIVAIISAVVVVGVVVTLVVTQVVVPNRNAARAEASASAASASASASAAAKAQEDYESAVSAFNKTSQACTEANAKLQNEILISQPWTKTDPTTMQEPSLIDTLNQVIVAAQAITPCAAPEMATNTDAIQQQNMQLGVDTARVTGAISALDTAHASVENSVQAKKDAEAQAKVAAQQGTFSIKDASGYTYGRVKTNTDG